MNAKRRSEITGDTHIKALLEEEEILRLRVSSLEYAIDAVLRWHWEAIITENTDLSPNEKAEVIAVFHDLETARGKR